MLHDDDGQLAGSLPAEPDGSALVIWLRSMAASDLVFRDLLSDDDRTPAAVYLRTVMGDRIAAFNHAAATIEAACPESTRSLTHALQILQRWWTGASPAGASVYATVHALLVDLARRVESAEAEGRALDWGVDDF